MLAFIQASMESNIQQALDKHSLSPQITIDPLLIIIIIIIKWALNMNFGGGGGISFAK